MAGPAEASAGTAPAGATRREFLSYALAASGALFAAGGLVAVTAPDPSSDPLVSQLLPGALNPATGAKAYPLSGGFAYPRIKAGTFGGAFTLDEPASAFVVANPPVLIADGKFYVVKVAPDAAVQPVANADGQVNSANLVAIYQVCTHLGCLVPYIVSERRFICPCHGSTFERDSQLYVRTPQPGPVSGDGGERHGGDQHRPARGWRRARLGTQSSRGQPAPLRSGRHWFCAAKRYCLNDTSIAATNARP